MMLWSNPRPFCATTWVVAAAASVLLASGPQLARAETAQQAAISDTAKTDGTKPDGKPSDTASQSQQKSLTDKAVDKVKQVAKSAGDIFSRVPCLPPKGAPRTIGSLPRVAHKLAAGEPVVII